MSDPPRSRISYTLNNSYFPHLYLLMTPVKFNSSLTEMTLKSSQLKELKATETVNNNGIDNNNYYALWTPKQEDIDSSAMVAFISHLNARYPHLSLSPQNYWKLYHWSIEEIESFWKEIWDFCGINGLRTIKNGESECILGEY